MPTPYRFTSPVPKKTASGQVDAVYAQMATDFLLADGPLMSLSPAPDLLAATWSLLREAQLAGRAPRTNKEVVATAVSAANHCQFCVDAHAALIHATGAHQLAEAVWRGETPVDPEFARLVAWSKATARPGAAELSSPPFPAELSAEYTGTALATHFINRMVSSLLHESLLPGRLQRSGLVRRIAGGAMSRAVRREVQPGRSLSLLAGNPAGELPVWAGDSPIGLAFAALRDASARGGASLSEPARALVLNVIASWDGSHPPLAGHWLEEPLAALPATSRPGARLALLAAVAPHGVTDADVAAWRTTNSADADLLRLIAFGAFAAVERIEASIQPSTRSLREEIDTGDRQRLAS